MDPRSHLTLCLAAALAAGCGTRSHLHDDAGPDVPAPGATTTAWIGPEGGSLVLGDLAVDVPAGALASEIRITVTATDDTVPFQRFSPVYRLEPADTVLVVPATVRMPFVGDAHIASAFRSAPDGAFVALPTFVEGSVARIETSYLGAAFVGTACAGGCCRRARPDLDVLLVVDGSRSMAEEQEQLAAQLPRLAAALATGDVDGDGTQDFPALRSVHLGTVTTDMGTGGHTIPTCHRPNGGDDGVLRTLARAPGCAASYAPVAELSADAPDVARFVEHAACVATVGDDGCGFEQPLESAVKALTPSTARLRFHRDTTGHGDGANAGFLRSDSVLATIVLTDEDDCSARDDELFAPWSSRYGTDLNLRCSIHAAEALHPAARYAAGLRALRADPSDLVFAVIAGVPPDLANESVDVILRNPRLEERPDPTTLGLAPSCTSPDGGRAAPPRRLLEVARSLGESAVVGSICDGDLTPAVEAILRRTAARVSGACDG